MKTIEFKIYPNKEQQKKLEGWLRTCCWIYNHSLAKKSLAYKRRKQSMPLEIFLVFGCMFGLLPVIEWVSRFFGH